MFTLVLGEGHSPFDREEFDCKVVYHPEADKSEKEQVINANGLLKRSPIVVFTYSVIYLRCLQLAVLRGEIDAKDVSILWKNSDKIWKFETISINPKDASLSGLPPDAFETEQKLAKEIFDVRWEKDSENESKNV